MCLWFYLPTVSPLWYPSIPLCNIPVFLFPLFICLLFQVSPAFPIVCHTPLFLLLPLPYFVSVILFSQVEERILVGICVPPGGGTHITRDMCFPGGEHISLGICVSQVGECIRHFEVARETGSRWWSSALWDRFGGRIFIVASNWSPTTVPQCTLTTVSTQSPTQPQSGEYQ